MFIQFISNNELKKVLLNLSVEVNVDGIILF
jgi:hypothetical protein